MSAKWTFWAWEQDVKTAPKKLALLQLANNANDDGLSWYSIGKMASACGVGDRTLQRQIQSLEEDGYLTVERRSNRPSIYKLIDGIEVTLKDSLGCQSDTVGCQSDTVGCQSDTSGGVRESHDPNSNPNTTPNSINNIDRCFENLWLAGMKKVNKPGAKKSFIAQFKKQKLSEEEFTEILIADIKKRLGVQFGFDSLHMTTYLNQQRWNDELSSNQQSKRQSQGVNYVGDNFTKPAGWN